MKIFVGIPAYDHKIHAATMMSLLDEQIHAKKQGHSFVIGATLGCSSVHIARDKVAGDFLDSDCDVLFWLDADISWSRGALTNIATHGEEFVGACYPYKQEPMAFPITWQANEITKNERGLCEALTLPGGFLATKRSVFKKLREAFPGREYEHWGRKYYGYFRCPPGNGEDTAFCQDWREIGGKVWVDIEVPLSHWEAGREYKGRLGDWLRSRS
jgi:hypothetical protein